MVDDRRTGTWVTTSGGRARTLAVRRCRLVVLSGPDQGRAIDLGSTVIRVGAHGGNDLVLSDRLVSSHHLEIALDDAGYRLRDLDSTNGTWVSGHRVRDLYLNPGTVVYVGESRLRFEPLEEAVEVALSERDRFGELVGASVAMRALYAVLERIAPTDASVLVNGETGTGKELVAEAIHRHSARKDGPFVVVDCGSIPDNLIASELFGHEKGAFTGALSSYAGAFERANGGTVFLDEIGELPMALQPNLLGALERRQVRRLGGSRPIPLDIRVVAATNRDLAREMNRGQFRSDLFYRLAVVRVQVPALRDRLDDLPLLVEHFLQMMPAGHHGMPKETLDNLRNHGFPGNVRELRNLVERAVILPSGLAGLDGALAPPPSPLATSGTYAAVPAAAAPAAAGGPAGLLQVEVDDAVPYRIAKQRLVVDFDARYFGKLLKRLGGNVSAVARAAGLDRMTVHKMMQRAGLTASRGRIALDDD
jgi:DNA-binding NtrC family response regulator